MKTVLITGASRGIGAEIAREFAKGNCFVAINYNKSELEAKQLRDELLGKGLMAKIYKADVADVFEVRDMISEILQTQKHIDVLVNNAGIAKTQLFSEMLDEDFDEIVAVNLKGMCLVTREVVKSMISRKEGSIINISSIWGKVGGSTEVLYSMTKAGIIGFTKALAKELGLSNIRVNCICPGVIETNMNSNLSKEDMICLANDTALGRIGKPKDVAGLACFLASDKASYITGQAIVVDGGFI